MTWVKFDSIELFNAWHNEIKASLGMPYAAINAFGSEVESAQVTSDYTKPHIVASDDVRADVEPAVAEGLVLAESPYANDVDER